MDNQDLREKVRRQNSSKLVERLRTDIVERDLRRALLQLRFPRYWIARLYVILSILTNMLVIYFEPQSLGHLVLLKMDPAARLVLEFIIVLSLGGLVDVVVNDVLPSRFSFRFGARWRHLGFMALSISLASLMFLITAAYGNSGVNFVLGLDMAMAASIGVLAPFSRHRWDAK